MRRKNRAPNLTPERFVYTIVLGWATYHSIKILIMDF